MFSGEDYGPNTAQVRRFIDRLRGLTPIEWERIRATEASAKAAYGEPNWTEIQVLAEQQYGRDCEKRLISPAVKRLDFVTGLDHHHASSAVMALVLCEALTPAQFSACYAPFADLIPVESLGKGKAPAVSGPPETIWGRFVTRIHALEGPEWQQVVRTALALQDAVGVEATDAALEAASFEKAGADEAERRAEEVNALLESTDSVGREYVGSLREVLKGVERLVKRDDFADSHGSWIEAELDNFKTVAARALFALAARDYMPPQQFALLYLPFAGLIPVESLDVERPGQATAR